MKVQLHRFACVLSCLCLAIVVRAQSPEQYVKYGDKAVLERNAWNEAYGYYTQAYALDSSSVDIRRKVADAAREVKYYPMAYRMYKELYDIDEGKTDPNALYYMAWLEKTMGRYEDAQRNFKKFTKKYKATADRKLVDFATHEVKASQWALNNMNKKETSDSLILAMMGSDCHDIQTHQAKLPKEIVGSTSEMAPVQQGDQFYYSYFHDEIWSVKRAQLKFDSIRNPTILPKFEQLEGIPGMPYTEESQAGFSMSGDRVYFSQVNNDFTQLMTGSWQDGHIITAYVMDVVNAEGGVNTMPQVAVIDGKEHLFFVSDRPGGEGGLDIWYSVNDDGWKKPKNAGKRVNSEGDEITPFYHDGRLFFSSNWHVGYGGMDVFYANRKGESFDKPVNIGKTINGTFNELSFSVSSSKKDGRCSFYYASNKQDSLEYSSACCNDLYMLSAVVSCGEKKVDSTKTTIDGLMRELPVVLYFHNDEPNPKTLDTTTTLSYLDAYQSYTSLKDEYIRENTKGLEGEARDDKEEITKDFFELKVDKGIQDLNRFSDALLAALNAGGSYKIYVRGFASPRARTDYNLNLTKRRTASLVNYLMADSSGSFVPYLRDVAENGAKLEVELLPFGEMKADMTVSDNLVDARSSIYNRAACMERRIEIEKVIVIPPTPKRPILELSEPCVDFGIIPRTGGVEHEFLLCNSGNAPMVIDSVTTECGCTTPTLDKKIVLPGEFATLIVGFDPLSRHGKDIKEVYVHIAGEEPRIILLEAERRK
ncbi:MAG: DUF1573 domain-containing protein [Flavobacteriales bacterium]